MADSSLNKASLPNSASHSTSEARSNTPATDAWEAFLVRIDTATMGVPEANLASVLAQSEQAVAPQPAAALQATAALTPPPQASPPATSPKSETIERVAADDGPKIARNERPQPAQTDVPEASPTPRHEPSTAVDSEANNRELRESIANQMLQAVQWEEEPIDAFIGGFPLIDESENKAPAPAPVRPEARRDSSEPIDELREASQDLEQVHAPEPGLPPVGELANGIADGEPVAEAPFAEQSHEDKDSGRTAPVTIAGTQLSSADVERIVAEYMARQQPSSGAIFRLDRPSYSETPAARDESGWDDSGEESLAIEAPSQTDIDIEALSSAQDRPSLEANPIDEVEAKLRQAQLPAFNPVWEVDQFQWPEVCLQLIDQKAESLNRVAANLFKACQEGLQLMAVTSPQSGEGRTTVACCLAKLAGAHGLRVAFVDGDLENPTLCLQTNLEVESDWKAALDHRVPLEEAAVHSIDDHVTLLPLLETPDRDEFSHKDERFGAMLQRLAHSFDLVIVDSGHLQSSDNMVTQLGEQGLLNAVVLVVDERVSEPQSIEQCLVRLKQAGIASVGLVENFVEE